MPALLLVLVIAVPAVLLLAQAVPHARPPHDGRPSERIAGAWIKSGVDEWSLRPEILAAAEIAVRVAGAGGFGPVLVTSTNEGPHLPDSLHFHNLALDLRSSHLPEDRRRAYTRLIREKVSKGYDVLNEGPGPSYDRQSPAPHIHLEYDPKVG